MSCYEVNILFPTYLRGILHKKSNYLVRLQVHINITLTISLTYKWTQSFVQVRNVLVARMAEVFDSFDAVQWSRWMQLPTRAETFPD